MKKRTGLLVALLLSCVILPGLIYLGLAIYYQDSFYYGTWINGIYCTGKTIEEVQKEMTEGFSYSGLAVKGNLEEIFLSAKEIDLEFDFQPALTEYLNRQNPFRWFYQAVMGQQNISLMPVISFQEEKLEEWFSQTELVGTAAHLPEDSLTIVLTDAGYELKEDKADILQPFLAKEKIAEALYQGKEAVDLEKEGCYFQREDTPSMKEIRILYEKIDALQQLSLSYTIKDQVKVVTPGEIALWIKRDKAGDSFIMSKAGELTVDEQAIKDFVAELAKEYDTWHNHQFTAHDGRKIHLKKGNYGIQIDQKSEIKFLQQFLKEGSSQPVTRNPEYIRDITYNNRHGIDSTYIEIDMGQQKLFYFQEGELKLETEVVTGCTKKGMGTPEMVCYVYNKKEDAVLRGENYRSYVNYWVPVYGGIGIHDATWRSRFGGEIYIRDGSHGCINTPLEKMEELYGMIEVGIPAVTYY